MEGQKLEYLPIADVNLNADDCFQKQHQIHHKIKRLEGGKVESQKDKNKRKFTKKFNGASVQNKDKQEDNKYQNQIKKDEIIQKRTIILTKIFKDDKNIQNFVLKTLNNKSIGYIIKSFAIEQKKNVQIGLYQENNLSHNKKQKRVRNFNKSLQKANERVSKKYLLNKEIPQKEMNKQREKIRLKGKALLKMIEVFGAQNSKQYLKFIQNNFDLQQQEMIQQWEKSL